MVAHNSLYDETGVLIPPSCYMRGEAHHDEFRLNLFAPPTHDKHLPAGETLPPGRYLWLGFFHGHFGHFLLSTLQRLWCARSLLDSDYQVLTPTHDALSHFDKPFVGQILEACGIRREMIRVVATGTVIPDVVVPQPIFAEFNHVFASWSRFIGEIGDRLAGPDVGRSSDRIYLTREKLAGGTRRILREEEVTEKLRREGVQVVSPEALSITEQIRLWRRHEFFAGYAGSAMHMAAFARGKALVSAQRSGAALANQTMIDEAGGHRAIYLNASHVMSDEERSGHGFDVQEIITEPGRVADAILRSWDTLASGAAGMTPRAADATIGRQVYAFEPFGRNVARNKTATMSSVLESSVMPDGRSEQEAERLVSGRSSRSYQIHTQSEQDPWWQVDLGEPHHIYEIRVFNRVDAAFERAANLKILTSDDGHRWEERAARNEPGQFGGGEWCPPFRWRGGAPVLARFVRVLAPVRDCLHLDQVEVFGYPDRTEGPLVF